jgi:hypothetical protein
VRKSEDRVMRSLNPIYLIWTVGHAIVSRIKIISYFLVHSSTTQNVPNIVMRVDLFSNLCTNGLKVSRSFLV